MVRILLIEDDANIRESVVDTLEYANYEAIIAEDGQKGIQIAKECEPDLILCDINMPERDGFEVFLTLQEYPPTSRVPFLFLTAMSTRDDIRRGMSIGADDYITKPFSASELLEALQTRLNRHKQIEKYNVQQMEVIRRYINMALPHELRTPLSSITGYLYLLRDSFEEMEPDDIRDMLDAIQQSANRLGHLVENYVAYSQTQMLLNDPTTMLKVRDFSYVDGINDVIHIAAEKIAYRYQRSQDLVLDCVPGKVHIFYDHANKLMETLLDNAFKFSSMGTPVQVTGAANDEYYEICITNEGRGMTSEQIASIMLNNQFEREIYEQQGTGLGLPIARTIVELYKGTLTINSVPDVYLTYIVRLQLQP